MSFIGLTLGLLLGSWQSQADRPVLGYTGCAPTLFRPLPSGTATVSVSEVQYFPFGHLSSYVEEYSVGSGPAVRSVVTVTAGERGQCGTYAVVAGGHTVTSVAGKEAPSGTLGFRPDEIGGVVFTGSLAGDFQTRFTYDSFGRRQLQSQTFTIGEHTYQVDYSDVAFGGTGRLVSYRATVKRR